MKRQIFLQFPFVAEELNMMKILALLLSMATITGCNQTIVKSISTTSVNVDSLTATFAAGWNNKDSTAIMKTIGDSAILRHASLIHKGHSAIVKNWVGSGVKVLNNLKFTSLIKDSDDKIAYNGGTFTHDISLPGQPLYEAKGNYNLVWTIQPSGEWKLKFIHIY